MWGLAAPLPATHDHHGICLILAFYPALAGGDFKTTYMNALFIDDQGTLRTDGVLHFKTEWRFNWTTHKWEDTDIEEFFDEPEDHGGPEVSGEFPDADRTD